ncbi:MAG TPA: hypothetical protein VGE52_18375 [Pirellulales bacterium]
MRVFVPEPHRAQAIAMHPECVSELLWGGKSMGVRIELAQAPADFVKRLLRRAWGGKAPKSLLANSPDPDE